MAQFSCGLYCALVEQGQKAGKCSKDAKGSGCECYIDSCDPSTAVSTCVANTVKMCNPDSKSWVTANCDEFCDHEYHKSKGGKCQYSEKKKHHVCACD